MSYNQADWRNLNRMPAAFRRKTTDQFIMANKKILAATADERITVHRSLTEALTIAQQAPEFAFLDNSANDRFTFCTLDGRNYFSRVQARQAFINVCRQVDAAIAAQIITVWYDEQWLQLQDAFRKTQSDL